MSDIRAGDGIDVAKRGDVNLLKPGAVGLVGVLFLTVTGAAPMSAMLGNVPFATGYGNGIYVPAAFLLATIVLTIFSVGYAAMARKVSTVGGFYSFISHGLGREVGMAAGVTSFICYSVFEASLYGLFAFFGNKWLNDHFGIDIPWLYLALFCIVLASIFSYFEVKLSAAILGIALILEVLILAIFDFGVLFGSGSNFQLESLNILNVLTPVAAQTVGEVNILAGAAAVGVFMAFWSWVGFEMAPNYAEESRDPKRIVPRSLYISVIGLGLFYIVTSWCAVAAFPTGEAAVAKAYSDGGNFFLHTIRDYVGTWAFELMYVLILTSSFACGMAFHNTASRYLYSLGREGLLPSALGKTHPTYKSPHVASVIQSILAVVWVVGFRYIYGSGDANADAFLGVYTLFAVLGTMLLLVLQAIVSLAVIAYFNRVHPEDRHWFATLVAPIIAFIAQAILVYLLIDNLTTFAGTGGFALWIPYIGVGVVALGLIWGFIVKFAHPEAFNRVGRLVNNSED